MKLLTLFLVVLPALGQQPRISNARTETHPVTSGLEAEMARLSGAGTGPEWAGYSVPMISGEHQMCCRNSDRACACSLEPHGSNTYVSGNGSAASVKLEGPGTLVVLFRLAGHAVDKVQTYSIDCELDAGGLPFHWLTGVAPEASLHYLESLAPVHNHAIMAIALHSDARADAALERLAAVSQPEKVREDVAFWSGSARGSRGVQLLKQMRDQDPSGHVREKVMFGMSISKDPSATALLIDSAKNDRSGEVRGKALFWLAQKAGQKETAAITRAIDDDPDTHVKKQAVFALQQLPHEQGIPLLIQVARSNRNPEVRKQAMFWLGQSQDPRALQFFEEVLAK